MPNASNRKGDRLNLHRFGEVQLVRTVTVRHSCISWPGRYISPSGVWGAARAARVGDDAHAVRLPDAGTRSAPPVVERGNHAPEFRVAVRAAVLWVDLRLHAGHGYFPDRVFQYDSRLLCTGLRLHVESITVELRMMSCHGRPNVEESARERE